jgi:nuclear pore complex protein Nup205
VRAALYAALLSFLQYVRPARLAQLPGSVLSAARNWRIDSSKVDAALVQAAEQNELEASTSSLIRRDAGPLVELIARDVTVDGVDDELKATALATVEALVAATVVASGGSSEVSSHRNGGHAGGAPGTPLGMHGVGNAFGTNLNAFGSPAAVGSAFQRGAAASASRLKPNGTSFNGVRIEASTGTPYGQSDSAQTHLDPAVGALGQSLARSGIVRACLAAVERAALPDLILPTAAAAAKLASVRAALSLLLRLAQLPGGGARALASSGAMAALTNCRAIDAYTSDGPGDAAAVAAQATVRSSNFNNAGDEYDSMGGLTFDGGSTYGGRDENANPNAEYEGNGRGAYGGQGGSREGSGLANSPIAPLPLPRARHHALLVPVLRLAGTLVNALCAADDAGEMHASGIAFLEAHKSVISRILSDRTRHAHLSDLAELEAAVTLVARLVAHRRGDVNDVVNQPAGSNTGTPGVPGIQAPGLGTPAQSPSALSAHRWRVVDEFIPALDALTAKLITGDGKYDAYIAAGSPDGSPSASTSHAEIARRLAHERAKGYAAFGGTNANNSGGFPELGGLEPPAAAAAAARMERSLRAVRAALVSTQLALAEQGRATFRATDPNRHLEMDAAANPKPALSNFARLVARVSEELGCEVRTRVRLLRRLAADGGAAAAAAVAADAFGGFSGGAELAAAAAAAANLNGGSFPFSGAAEASAAAAAVAARERAVRVLSHTCEASLELILGRLWSRTGTGIQSHGYSVGSSFPNVPAAHSPYGGVGSAFVRDGSAPAQGYAAPNASYSSSEIAELSAILTPAISALSELTDLGGNPEDGKEGSGGLGQLSGLGDGGRLRGLIRRTRDTLLAAVPAGVAEPPTLLLAGDRSSIGNEFGVGGNSFGVNSPAGNYPAQSPLPPPRFGLFNA